MPTNTTQPGIPNAAELEPLLNGDLNDLTAEILPDLPNSFAGEVGAAVYEMAQSGDLPNAEEADFFAAIDTEIATSDKTWLDRLTEGDWGYFAFAAAESFHGTWFGNVLDFFLPDFLDLQAQKERVLQLTQNPHNILINLRERVDRASAIPGMETAAFGLPVSDIETLTNHLEEHTALLESFPYESDAQAQADWWAEAFTDAGLTAPSAVVLSVLSGEAEWTLFLGDANQRILQQVSATTPETPAAEVSTEMTEVNGVMMSPEYGEMVLLEDTEFYNETQTQLGSWQRYLHDNSYVVSLLSISVLGSLVGDVSALGSLTGIANLPLDHPLVAAASVSTLLGANEDVHQAYYPQEKEAFIRFIRDKAESSAEPYAQRIAQLSEADLGQLHDWLTGVETPSLEGMTEAVQPYLDPTPANQWRQTQLEAFTRLRNTSQYLPPAARQDSDVLSTLDEIRNLYRNFNEEDASTFNNQAVLDLITQLNQQLSTYDRALVAENNTLYIEYPDTTTEGASVSLRLALGINPHLELTEQWQAAPYFFGESGLLSTSLEGASDSLRTEFSDIIGEVHDGSGMLAVLDGTLFFISGSMQRVVPYELLGYLLGTGENGNREWSMQQFAYTYGGAASSLMLIGATSGLITGGRAGAWLGLAEGLYAPINTLQHAVNPRLALAQVRSQLRQSRHFISGFAGRLVSPERAGAHRELRRLEELRSIMARYEFSTINRHTPILADAMLRRANDIIRTSPIELPFRSIQDGNLSQKLGQLDSLIREQRATRLTRSLGERLSVTGTPERRVSIIEEIDVVIEHLERRKSVAVRNFIQALNSGDSRMMAYAQEQLTRQVQHGQQVISHVIPLRRQAFATLSESAQARVGSAQSLLERLRGRIELPHLSPRGRLGLAAGVAALAGVLLLERVLADEDAVAGSRPTTEELLAENGMGTLSPRADQTSFSPLETTFIQRFETLDLVQGLSANDASSRLTPEGVDALVENHELVINDLREALTEPANQAALRTILEEAEDQRLEIGTVALTLEDGEVFLHSTTPSRFEDVYWQMVDQVDGTFQQRVASTTGSEILGYTADMGAYMVPFVGPGRDLTNAWTDFQRGNWRSFANNALFGVVGGAIDTIAWGGSLVTLGGSAVVGTGAKGALAAVRTGIRAPRAIRAARVADLSLMASQVGGAAYSIFQGSHNRHERLF